MYLKNTKGFGGESPQKIKCVYNTFSSLCVQPFQVIVCTMTLWETSVCTMTLLAIFKTTKMAKNHRFSRKSVFR